MYVRTWELWTLLTEVDWRQREHLFPLPKTTIPLQPREELLRPSTIRNRR